MHVCSGLSSLGDLRIDFYVKTNANWIEDGRDLTLPSEFADTVVCDPPYLDGYLDSVEKIWFQCIRILKPGGRLIWYHVKIPWDDALELEDVYIRRNMTRKVLRLLSVHRKIQRSLSSKAC